MKYNRYSTHSVHQLTAHLVWITKYRYPVLHGEIQLRTRDLIKQICDANDIKILKGAVSKDHIHLHISYPPKLSISEIIRKIKGRTGRKLLQEYSQLKKKYWSGHFWAIGYGVWSTGNLTQEMIQEYLEHHNQRNNQNNNDNFILE